jgi:hypothetical protein
MIKIKEINHGIACRIGNVIFVNQALRNYPSLREAILQHEKKHTDAFRFYDFWLDFSHKNIPKKEYWKFVLTHPSALSEFSPIWVYNQTLTFNFSLLILYFIILMMGVLWIIL